MLLHRENRGEFMTLDEAIIHAREVASEQKRRSGACVQNDSECDKFSTCLKCAEEHDQIAEWLEDYKHIKQWKSDIMDEFCKYDVSSFEELVTNTRNKAIDDFVTKYKFCDNRSIQCRKALNCADCIAEQLKAGVAND